MVTASSVMLSVSGVNIVARRGKRIAVVALARSLAGITYAMWRDGRPYDASQLRMPRPRVAQTS